MDRIITKCIGICPRHPLITIAVAVYGVEEYLERCLDSLVKQTLQDIEILVINDSSLDGSQDIIDQYMGRYPNIIRSVLKPNGGVASVRNYAIEHALGEYLAFVDGDDWVAENMYEVMTAKALKTDSDYVICDYFETRPNQKSLRKGKHIQKGEASMFGSSLKESPIILPAIGSYPWNRIYRTQALRDSGLRYPIGMICEDTYVSYCFASYANRIEKVQLPLYYYSKNRIGSEINTFDSKLVKMFDVLNMVVQYYKPFASQELMDRVEYIYVAHFYYRFRDMAKYKGLSLKYQILSQGNKNIKAEFPNWTNSSFFARKWHLRSVRWFKKPIGRYFRAFRTPNFIKIFKHLRILFLKARRLTKWIFFSHKTAPVRFLKIIEKSKVVKKSVLFQCFHGSFIAGSPFYMLKELSILGTHDCYVAAKDPQKIRSFLDAHEIQAHVFDTQSREYLKVTATAEYIVDSSTMPWWWNKQPGQKYINTWHGVPLKTLGTASPHALVDSLNVTRCFRQADFLCHPNRYTYERINESYMLHNSFSNTSLVCGSPRNAILFSEDQRDNQRRIAASKLHDVLSVEKSSETVEHSLINKFVYLYMPTWRGRSMRQIEKKNQYKKIEEILSEVESRLPDDSLFMVKLHPFVTNEVDFSSFKKVVKAPELFETSELMCMADCLVTDYSSALFDFSVTKRPIVLFTYDVDKYSLDRAMYLSLEELPFSRYDNLQDFVSALCTRDFDDYSQNYQCFVDTYMPFENPNAASLLNSYLFGDKKHAIEEGFVFHQIAHERMVDAVLMPPLGRRGQRLVQEYIESKQFSPSTLFVFPFSHKYTQLSNDFIFDLIHVQGIDISFANMTGKIYTNRVDKVLLILNRKYGLFQNKAVSIYAKEYDRLFTGLDIRSFSTYSYSTKALMLCKVFESRGGKADYCLDNSFQMSKCS